MDKVHRIHIGPENGGKIFSNKEIEIIETVLDRYFKGWLTVEGTARTWDGKIAEMRAITVTSSEFRLYSGKDPLDSCIRQLRGHFPTSFIMVEESGIVLHLDNNHEK